MTRQYWQNKKINGNELYIQEPLRRMIRKINTDNTHIHQFFRQRQKENANRKKAVPRTSKSHVRLKKVDQIRKLWFWFESIN